MGALQITSEEGNLTTLNKIQEELWRKTHALSAGLGKEQDTYLVAKQTKRSVFASMFFVWLLNLQKEYDEKM